MRAFRAMGSECSIRVVVGDDRSEPMLDRAVDLVRDLERRWSRFLPDSELSHMNEHAGVPVVVTSETAAVVALAVEGWRATGGLFDPSMLDALLAAGYDMSIEDVRARRFDAVTSPAGAAPRALDGVSVDRRISMVLAPKDVRFDLGGVGKGRAADLVVEQLLDEGAIGACADLGGDLRVGGLTADGTGWPVAIDDPSRPGRDLVVIGLTCGGAATSSVLRRRWRRTDGEVHHLLDPRTGRSTRSGLVAVTALAAETAWAEIHAKAALVAGPVEGRELVERAGLSALFVDERGGVDMVGHFEDFVLDTAAVGSPM